MNQWVKWPKWQRWGSPPAGNPGPAPEGIDLYWVGDVDGDWHNGLNWSTSSGGPGGAGYPGATNDVYIDRLGNTTLCTLQSAAVCKNFNFIEIGDPPLPQGEFDQNGQSLTCVNFYYDNDLQIGGIQDSHFDGPITVSGTFEIATADYDDFYAEGAVITFPNAVTVNSSIDLPTMVHEDDVIYPTAKDVQRLILDAGVTATFKAGAILRIFTYTLGDWDGAIVQSDNPGTAWILNNFGPGVGGMVVSDMTVTDSTASPNEIDATDNCTDGGGNTNWDFGTVWKFDEAGVKWNEANVKWNEAGL